MSWFQSSSTTSASVVWYSFESAHNFGELYVMKARVEKQNQGDTITADVGNAVNIRTLVQPF